MDARMILEAAADLLSEDGENPEYDRAIVELTYDLVVYRGFFLGKDWERDDLKSLLRRMKGERR